MKFPTNSTKAYVRIDGRSGSFALSSTDGGDLEIVEMRSKVLDLDFVHARQGWLHLSENGPDWVQLDQLDDWTGTPRPSPDHNPAVEINVYSPSWPDPRVRQLRASSRCVTSFISRVADAAGAVPDDKAVRIRLGAARVIKIGKGSSAEIGFDLAPRDKWPDRTAFDEDDGCLNPAPEPAPAPAAPGMKPGAFDDLEDSAWT